MSSTQHIKIIIAGGGTGGHIFPAVAIANAIKKMCPTADILFVGANGKMEMEKVPKEGYKIIGLDIAGFNRSSLLKNITLPFKILKSFSQAKSIINEFKPNLCIGVGGYASFPLLYMAQRAGVKTLIQEQNSFAGKANKILSKRAVKVCTGYDGMERFFPKEKIVYTGNPVRATITNSVETKSASLHSFELEASKKTIFVFGGSLGAKSINDAVGNNIENIVNENNQLLWQTGTSYFSKAKEIASKYNNVKVYDFIREMNKAYESADVVVARAGALSIAELCIVAKPVIFVPFPHASEDHQTHNAMALVNKEAALIINDADVNNDLPKAINDLANNEILQQQLIKNIKPFAITNADEQIASIALNCINEE
jgi:UDP-N-acetylglucosamine--N-acetylmuramyl-(pentapeptide) pyrophosphoryl-undecaprenol N-acetylglucosamine transferase